MRSGGGPGPSLPQRLRLLQRQLHRPLLPPGTNRSVSCEVELENALLSHMDQVMRDGSLLQDEIGLCFSTVKWAYTQQKIGGGVGGGSTAGGWDLAAKKCCA